MKQISAKEPILIFNKREEEGSVTKNQTLDTNIVDLSDVEDALEYYGGLIFVPSIATHLFETDKKNDTAEAVNFKGVGTQ